MTIYFDTNKNAYISKETIENFGQTYVCEIDDDTWINHSNNEVGSSWDIIDGVFTDLADTDKYINEQFAKLKTDKLSEINSKAYEYQQNGTVEYKNCLFEISDSNRKNLSDTQEALTLQGLNTTQWNSKDDTLVELTVDDIQNIRLNLILGEIQKVWLVKQPYFKNLVEKATTMEELNAINIDYN